MVFIRNLGFFCKSRFFFVKLEFCRELTLSGIPRKTAPWVPGIPDYAVFLKPVIKGKHSIFREMVFVFSLSKRGSVATGEGLREGCPPCGFLANFKRWIFYKYIYSKTFPSFIRFTFRGRNPLFARVCGLLKPLFVTVKPLFVTVKPPFVTL